MKNQKISGFLFILAMSIVCYFFIGAPDRETQSSSDNAISIVDRDIMDTIDNSKSQCCGFGKRLIDYWSFRSYCFFNIKSKI